MPPKCRDTAQPEGAAGRTGSGDSTSHLPELWMGGGGLARGRRTEVLGQPRALDGGFKEKQRGVRKHRVVTSEPLAPGRPTLFNIIKITAVPTTPTTATTTVTTVTTTATNTTSTSTTVPRHQPLGRGLRRSGQQPEEQEKVCRTQILAGSLTCHVILLKGLLSLGLSFPTLKGGSCPQPLYFSTLF